MSIIRDLGDRLGLSKGEKVAEAHRFMSELSRRTDPEARLAHGIAEALVPSDPARRPEPDGMVRLALPALRHDAAPLPENVHLRRRYIADVALDAIERHVRDGSDEGLAPDLGRAARQETVRMLSLSPSDVRRSGLDDTLDRSSRNRARTTAAYLSDGPRIEGHMDDLLKQIPLRGETMRTLERIREVREFHSARQPGRGPELKAWVAQGLLAERTAARAGLIGPDRIVRIADQTMQGADVEHLSTLPRARPDFEAGRAMSPEARRETYKAERGRMTNRLPASNPAAMSLSPSPSRDGPTRNAIAADQAASMTQRGH